MQTDTDMFARELYLAGERVQPGLYKQVDGDRIVELEREDFLPASLDGQVACFVRVPRSWDQKDRGAVDSSIRAHEARPSTSGEFARVSSGSSSHASRPALLKRSS